MPTNLFGETFEATGDYSRRLLLLGLKQPYYKVSREPFSNHKCSLFIQDKFGERIGYTVFDTSGLYAIYRFIKELYDLSHKDEDHPAAKKARRHGITDNNLYFKFLPMDMFPSKSDNSYVNDNVLDEYLAVMLQSKFNKKVRK